MSNLVRSLVASALAVAVLLPAAAPAVAEDGEATGPFIWPTRGRLTQNYGCTGFWAEPRRGSCAHFHSGLDIANRRGTPVVAVADGVVELVGWDPWLRPNPAWLVVIDHGNGLRTLYAHMRAKPVEGVRRGARVKQGQVIGLMDSTGRSTGPHLHFVVYRNGSAVNPRLYLSGKLQGRGPRRNPVDRSCISGYEGVGAWLGGATAILPKTDSGSVCPAESEVVSA